MTHLFRAAVLAVGLGVAATSTATFTVATFSDPSQNANQPLFLWDQSASTLTGAWTLPGLNLETPGLLGPGIQADMKLAFDTVTLTPIINGTLYQMSAGRIRFYTDAVENPYLTITFDGGLFQTPVAVGGSSLIGNNVHFSGDSVPNGLSQEQFSFSLANMSSMGSTIGFTSSFTSSAVPEPASMAALGLGVVALVRRRKR